MRFAKEAEREHALTSMPGEMPLCKTKPKENMLCQVCLVLQIQAEREHALLCQVCLVKCRFPKTS